MKICRWIDRTFCDSYRKRLNTLSVLAGLWWVWECAWCLWLYGQMAFVSGYDGLFSLQPVLDAYNGCFLIRTLLKCVRTYRLQWPLVSGLDMVMLGASGFLLAARPRGQKWILAGVFAGSVTLEALFVWMGFCAGSLNGVMFWLRLGGWCGLVLTGGVLVGLLYGVCVRFFGLWKD